MPGGIMGLLKITSLNVRSLHTPEKCLQLLADLRKCKTQVAFLQETHFRGDSIRKLTNGTFPMVYHGVSPISKSKGVSNLLANQCRGQSRRSGQMCRVGF